MIWLLWSFCAHGAVPPDVDLNDVFAWEDAADQLLDGPGGCWMVEGIADRKVLVFAPPDMFSNGQKYEEVLRADVQGRLEDGEWKGFRWDVQKLTKQQNDVNPLVKMLPMLADELDILPLIGRMAVAQGKAPSNLVRDIVDEWGGRMATSLADWDDERGGVWLRREVPVRDKPKAPVSQVDTFFPSGGHTPERMDVAFPKSFKAGAKGMRFRLDDAQIHLRTSAAHGAVHPTAESASLLLVGLGITIGYEQTIRYTAFEPCVSELGAAPADPQGDGDRQQVHPQPIGENGDGGELGEEGGGEQQGQGEVANPRGE